VIQWPRPGLPVLPQALRRLIGNNRLPSAVWRPLGLTADARLDALDASIWRVAPPRTVIHACRAYVANVVASRLAAGSRRLCSQPLFPDLAPGRLDLAALSLSYRTRSGLAEAGLLGDAAWLRTATAREVTALPRLGARSLLELVMLVEHHLASGSEAPSAAEYEPPRSRAPMHVPGTDAPAASPSALVAAGPGRPDLDELAGGLTVLLAFAPLLDPAVATIEDALRQDLPARPAWRSSSSGGSRRSRTSGSTYGRMVVGPRAGGRFPSPFMGRVDARTATATVA
jgi:hypothetical protein